MLQAHQIHKSYGVQTVLDKITFFINPGDRVGLVGANGCGKSTLLRILVGEEQSDSGMIVLSSGCSLGYLPQGLRPEAGLSVREYIYAALGEYSLLQAKIEDLAELLSQTAADESLLEQYGEALTAFENLGGYALDHHLESILAGLGLENISLEAEMLPLSGGERTRIGLARLLLAGPSVLLLDEPTNHLDIEALEWLEEFLQSYAGAVLVISHDRVFLDRTVNRILELNENSHQIKEFAGNYTDYVEVREKEREKLFSIWQDQQTEIRRMEQDVQRTKQQALSTEKGTKNDQQRRYAKKVAKKAKSKEKRLQHYMESDERIEKPTTLKHIRLDFGTPMRSGQVVANLEEVGQRFGERWLFKEVTQSLQYGERVALVGPNGSGKTTLLRIIQGSLKPSCGLVQVGPSVRIGYMPQQQETLDPNLTALQSIQALAQMGESEVFHFLHYFLFEPNEVRREVGNLSYGQRARLLLARLVVSGANFLLLDEPINHLDIPSRQQFEEALEAFPGTVLVSVHDRAFIERFATAIWRVRQGRIQREFEL